MDLKLDGDQLRRLLQNVKLIAEILALTFAGIWAAFNYGTLQRAVNHLALEQAKHKLQESIAIDPKVEIRRLKSPGGTFSWEVKYKYDIAITSEKDVPIDYVRLEWFIGTLNQGAGQILRANDPTTTGPIRWESRGIELHARRGVNTPALIGSATDRSRDVVTLQDEEGGVGTYEPGETVREDRKFYVTGQAGKWVGFSLLIGVKRNGSIEEYYSKTAERLSAETVSNEEPIEAAENGVPP